MNPLALYQSVHDRSWAYFDKPGTIVLSESEKRIAENFKAVDFCKRMGITDERTLANAQKLDGLVKQ
ncbi:hypothetical protein [Marinibactrum halimedae]|uniref:Uncharacterized protein n=1 Tax=Marinibactrum halimedae TaxID=1444977 RepID=A0AA37T5N4_9GAMM|nr:hypothetical protein [Marinibactrum halimedae]MCD9458910.1 hypothetical protein [Marinibactrum halimedae]GLS27758.1 hypothetical protein GCM10007877_34770 [Marinibactrum halimedae]